MCFFCQEDFLSMIRSLRDVALAACISFMVVLALSYSSLANLWEVTQKKYGKFCQSQRITGWSVKAKEFVSQEKIS